MTAEGTGRGGPLSRGVPRPSVLTVSTLLARERLMLLEERLEGARPRSSRRRRYGWGGSLVEGLVVVVVVVEEWRWAARREEMAGPRVSECSSEGGMVSEGGSFVGDGEGLRSLIGESGGSGGEEFKDVSRRGSDVDMVWFFEVSLPT